VAALPTIIEIRKMSVADILSEIVAIRRQATEVRMGVELSKEKDTSKMKNLRRHMARLLTVLQEKNVDTVKEGKSGKPGGKNTKQKSLSKKAKASKIPAQS
jgi:ribosomal protein L29